MRVREHMRTPVVTVRTDTDYKSALQVMHDKAIHHLPVVDPDGRLVGMAAERDLLLAAAQYLQSSVDVGDVMHKGAITATPEMLIVEAAELMVRNKIGGLPVVETGIGLVGIITETDVFGVLAGALRRVRYN